jgi:hypothetical protein
MSEAYGYAQQLIPHTELTPEMIAALTSQLPAAAHEEAPAIANYYGSWTGTIACAPGGCIVDVGITWDDGSKMKLTGGLSGIGASVIGALFRNTIVVHRPPGELPSLRIWSRLLLTPPGPFWPAWLTMNFWAGDQYIGKLDGAVVGIMFPALAVGDVYFAWELP